MSPGRTTNVSMAGAVVDMATRGCGDDVDDSASCSSDMTKRRNPESPPSTPTWQARQRHRPTPRGGIVEG